MRGTLKQLSAWVRALRVWVQMSGSDSETATLVVAAPAKQDGPIEKLESVFRRDSPVSALHQLRDGLLPPQTEQFVFRDAIVCLDTAGLINLAKHKSVATVLDYFQSRHPSKMLVSAQTILEFWNNHISAFETISASLSKRFGELEREVDKIDPSLGGFREEFKSLVTRFNEEFGHLHDASNRAKLTSLATQLPDCTEVFEAPRIQFQKFSPYRKSTKTPPGFKDQGDGDFFVWTDCLFGLLTIQHRGGAFGCSVMVTDDKKSDWSKGGVAHPLLAAEVKACVGVPFACWSVEHLVSAVQKEVGDIDPAAEAEAEDSNIDQ